MGCGTVRVKLIIDKLHLSMGRVGLSIERRARVMHAAGNSFSAVYDVLCGRLCLYNVCGD